MSVGMQLCAVVEEMNFLETAEVTNGTPGWLLELLHIVKALSFLAFRFLSPVFHSI